MCLIRNPSLGPACGGPGKKEGREAGDTPADPGHGTTSPGTPSRRSACGVAGKKGGKGAGDTPADPGHGTASPRYPRAWSRLRRTGKQKWRNLRIRSPAYPAMGLRPSASPATPASGHGAM